MANTFIKIASATVGSGGSSTVTFSSIPSTYTDLCVKVSARSTANGGQNVYVRINGTTSGYSDKFLYGTGSAAGSANSGNTTAGCGCVIPGADFTSNTFGNGEFYFGNYRSSNNKAFYSDSVSENNATLSYLQMFSNLLSNTAAITSLDFFISSGNFEQHSTLTLYGIKNS
jgi:hypothetical protein